MTDCTRLAYNQADAAKQLSVSVNTFVKHVRPFVRSVYIGPVRRWEHVELQRWLAKHAA